MKKFPIETEPPSDPILQRLASDVTTKPAKPLEISPADKAVRPRAHLSLAMIESRAGNFQEADRHFIQAKELCTDKLLLLNIYEATTKSNTLQHKNTQ